MVADQRHGVAVSTLANINRNTKAKRDPFSPGDFIHWGEDRQVRNVRKMGTDEMVSKMFAGLKVVKKTRKK